MRKNQIKAACAKQNITMGELAKRLGMSKQNFSARLQKEKFKDEDLDKIAEALGCKYVCYFEFEDGSKV